MDACVCASVWVCVGVGIWVIFDNPLKKKNCLHFARNRIAIWHLCHSIGSNSLCEPPACTHTPSLMGITFVNVIEMSNIDINIDTDIGSHKNSSTFLLWNNSDRRSVVWKCTLVIDHLNQYPPAFLRCFCWLVLRGFFFPYYYFRAVLYLTLTHTSLGFISTATQPSNWVTLEVSMINNGVLWYSLVFRVNYGQSPVISNNIINRRIWLRVSFIRNPLIVYPWYIIIIRYSIK